MILVFGIWIVVVPNKGLFKMLFEGKIRTITFGDGSKSVIRGIRTVDIPGLSVFEDVWYVDGLKAIYLASVRFVTMD